MFSFQRGRQRIELQSLVRRIVDLTSPNLPPLSGTHRLEERYNRTLPILVTAWQNGQAACEDLEYGTTRDVSDHGFSLVMRRPQHDGEILLTLWLAPAHQGVPDPAPVLLHGLVRQCTDFGAGYWLWGVELTEIVKARRLLERLRPAALLLLPHAHRAHAQAECYTPQVG